MILSLGSFVFASRFNKAVPPKDVPTPTPVASATPSASATATPTGTPTPDPSITPKSAAPPAMALDPTKNYDAVLHLETGDVRIHLLPEQSPGYVNNFVFLARNRFFEGLTFHRVVPGFVVQGGDPTGTGFGDAGYSLPEEKNGLPFDAGVLSMAKGGTRVNSSQFFITTAPAGSLNGAFTVFGRVTSGLDLLTKLPPRDPSDTKAPPGAVIKSIDIVEAN
jgi:cyclophilin family peptidyl-prolyl cis-trans isomerase